MGRTRTEDSQQAHTCVHMFLPESLHPALPACPVSAVSPPLSHRCVVATLCGAAPHPCRYVRRLSHGPLYPAALPVTKRAGLATSVRRRWWMAAPPTLPVLPSAPSPPPPRGRCWPRPGTFPPGRGTNFTTKSPWEVVGVSALESDARSPVVRAADSLGMHVWLALHAG